MDNRKRDRGPSVKSMSLFEYILGGCSFHSPACLGVSPLALGDGAMNIHSYVFEICYESIFIRLKSCILKNE